MMELSTAVGKFMIGICLGALVSFLWRKYQRALVVSFLIFALVTWLASVVDQSIAFEIGKEMLTWDFLGFLLGVLVGNEIGDHLYEIYTEDKVRVK